MKGIVLAGGTGSRLFPVTLATCKQLLPLYDKPLIYYPLSLLMMAGLRDIMIITTPDDQPVFQRLLGDGAHFGVSLTYAVQDAPRGIAEAFLIAEDFLDGGPCMLVLGDNVLFGHGLGACLRKMVAAPTGASLMTYPVADPQRFGVATFDGRGRVIDLVEKPTNPQSNQAVIGVYAYDDRVVDVARHLKPSRRGELEITGVNAWYLAHDAVDACSLGRGYAWLDVGTHEAMLQGSQFMQMIEDRQGLKIACLEEIAFNMGYIGLPELTAQAERLRASSYGTYLRKIIEEHSKALRPLRSVAAR